MLLLVGIILLAQLFFYLQKRQAIKAYANLFPDRKTLGTSRYRILAAAIETTPTDALLTDIAKFDIPPGATVNIRNLHGLPERVVGITLLAVSKPTPAFTRLAYAINAYLLRNSVATTDYNVLESIADRQSEALRQEARQSVGAPLALGFLGLLVLSGFLFYTQRAQPTGLVLETLLHRAHYVLLPVGLGLVLQQLLRNLFSGKAIAQHAAQKADFYTFLQTNLLPYLAPAPDGTMAGLHHQLQRFGQDFETNISRLEGLLSRNYDALIAQTNLLDALKDADLVAISGANVTVLQELQKSTGLLSGFNAYLTQVEALLQGLQKSVGQMNVFLSRTETIEELAGRAMAATAENRQLLAFLQSHYQELDKSRQLISNGVVDVNRTLQDALADLQRFTQEKIDRIRAMETYEAERLSSTEPAAERRQLRETLEAIRQFLQTR